MDVRKCAAKGLFARVKQRRVLDDWKSKREMGQFIKSCTTTDTQRQHAADSDDDEMTGWRANLDVLIFNLENSEITIQARSSRYAARVVAVNVSTITEEVGRYG